MANVLVCTAQVPFASGGAERHAAGLVRELRARGHRVDLVQLPFKWYPREELLSLYAGCGAVLFTPADEDYGYIALEAFLSKKPVVTCTDSGGPLEFVVDGETGRVAPPTGAAVGEAAAALLAAPEAARRMGERGYDAVRGISWDAVVSSLLRAGGLG